MKRTARADPGMGTVDAFPIPCGGECIPGDALKIGVFQGGSIRKIFEGMGTHSPPSSVNVVGRLLRIGIHEFRTLCDITGEINCEVCRSVPALNPYQRFCYSDKFYDMLTINPYFF